MSASWRKKSADLTSPGGGSARSRAAWLIIVVGLTASLVGSFCDGIPGRMSATGFACDDSTPEIASQWPLRPESASPLGAGSRFSREVELLFGTVLSAEQRRVCEWKRLSRKTPGRPFITLAWLTALMIGSMCLTVPLGVGFSPWRRTSTQTPTIARSPHNNGGHFAQRSVGAADGMMMVRVMSDGGFICTDVNPAWQQLVGEPTELHIGCEAHETWPASVADAMVERFRECIGSGQPLHFHLSAAEAKQRNLMIVICPVRELRGQNGRMKPIRALLCLAYDNAEQMQSTARLHDEERMQTIRRLAAGVAHDFNNILQAICGSMELILAEAASPSASIHELATIALLAAQRGSHLTQHLLAYAQRQVLTPQPIDLREFLPRMRDAIEQAIGPDNQLELEFVGDQATVFVDETNLRTALLNLAFNAGRAMPQGGRLRIETGPDSVDHFASVRILVHDTGAGMDAATLARCHEPFFTTKGATGTGLGLSMVQGFAAQSGGALRISSIPGQGTSAVLTLPACRSNPTPEINRPIINCIGRVLLVDDAIDVLITTGRMLQRAGFDVTPVQSGDAALAYLASGQEFDVLVTDYAMPGLSGVELIRLAREMQPGLPGLMITGFHEVDITRLRETAQVLRKPFQQRDLVNAVHEQLQGVRDIAQLQTS